LGSGEDKLFVRGLTDSVLPGLSDSIVGVYLDESRIVDDAPDPNLRLVDVDRVEVLRGPQGSLYGAGSLSGLVRIVTNKPDFNTFAATARASVSSTDHGGVSREFNGVLNLPLVPDELALRIVAYDDDQTGYIDETRLRLSDTNDTRSEGGRAQLGWNLNDAWNIIASVALQNTKAADSQYYLKSSPPLTRDNFLLEPHGDDFLQAGVTANGALGWAKIVTNTSFVDRNLNNRFDASTAWPLLTGFSLGPAPFDYTRQLRSFTHETRLSSTGDGSWEWVAGLFLAHRDEDFSSNLSGPNAAGQVVIARAEVREDRANEAALFGEVTHYFDSNWSVVLGARIFDASRKAFASGSGFLFTSSNTFNGTNHQTGFAPKAVVEYRPSASTTLYAQYSEGYRLGGLSADGPTGAVSGPENRFASDELHNYELGSKFAMWGGSAILDASTYYVTWNKVQTDQIAPDGAFYILNAGTVHDLGMEVEVALRPLRCLTLRGNFFWNNVNLSNTNPLLAGGEGVLPGAPDVTAGISARYDFKIGESSDGFASLDYSYVGVSHLGFGENTQTMGGYRLANARAGFQRGPWEFTLFVENFTNDRGNTFGFGNPFDLNRGPQVTPPRPRTIGVALDWSQ
jgi:outer membrane receptor protein involved in Fe transport